MNIVNVTVHKGTQGGTTLITHADGVVNGNQIEIDPSNVRWIPLPVWMDEYYIVDGNGQSWRALCTMVPTGNQAPGYFTAK